jgi:gluconokinase
MLSCDSPVPVNGKPAGPTKTMPAPDAAKVTLLPPPAATNGVVTNGIAAGVALNSVHPSSTDHHIWLVTGPAGCGKSTVARYLSKSLDLPYIEGDEVCAGPTC